MVIRINSERVRQKAETRGGAGWRPKNGQNYIRVLPHSAAVALGTETDVVDFCYEFNAHFINIEGEDPLVGRCPRDKDDERSFCPACKAAQRYRDSADPLLKEAARDVKRGIRFIFNILDLQNPGGGIQVMEVGWMVYKQIREYLMTDAWAHLLDPQHGHNLILNKTPGNQTRSGFTEYSITPDPQPSDITQYLGENWQAKLDETAAAVPEYIDVTEVENVLNRIGLVIDGDEVAAPAGAPAPPAGVTPPALSPPAAPATPPAAPPAPPTATPPAAPAAEAPPTPPVAPPTPPAAPPAAPPAPPAAPGNPQ